MRRGVRLGIDVGTVRIGVARSDIDGLLAVPVQTIERGAGAVEAISDLVCELSCLEIFVGLPLSLSGERSASTNDAIDFARDVEGSVDVPVRLIDERLTTVSAHGALRQSGRQASRSRSVVDQVAAVMLLQHALDSERGSGRIPGSLLTDLD